MSFRTLLSASALITSGMVVGRILGLFREMLLAAQFGTGSKASMAIILLIIPDFVTAAFIGSAISAVLLPAFVSRTEERIQALLWQTFLLSAALFSVIAIVCTWIFFENHDSTALLIAFASMPFAAVTATITAYLQYRSRFLVPAFANAIFNIVVLITLWLAPDNLVILALGIMGAALTRLLAHYLAYIKAGGTVPKNIFAAWELDKSLLVAYTHTAGSGICNVLPVYVPYMVVAAASAGLAAFNYAFKLVLFPAILVQTIIQMALLPWFVRVRAHTPHESTSLYGSSLQVAWAISLAVCLAFTLGAGDIADVCFGYGKMTPDDIARVGRLMAIGIWAAPGIILYTIWQQMLYAYEHTRPVLNANIALAVGIAPLCWIGNILLGLEGVMIANALAQLIPLYLLARSSSHLIGIKTRPSFVYARITVAVITVFVPLAIIFYAVNLSPAAAVALAILIGMVSLASGLHQCSPIRTMLGKFIIARKQK